MQRALLIALLTACSSGTDKDQTPASQQDDTADHTSDTSDTDTDTGSALVGFPTTSCADHSDPCVEIAAEDEESLHEAANLLEDNMTIILAEGTYVLDNQVTLRNGNGVSLLGQGMDLTLLDFSGQKVQTNGIDAIGDNFLVQDLTVLDAKKDGIRIEDSTGVTMRRVRATWTEEASSENGAYGLYPVRSSHVLVEECEAHNSADAGIYVGQVQYAVVRNNLATGNVAGIEIENTQYAEVYDNIAEENTGGLLVFDLPGNPIVGRDVWVHNNIIRNNNTRNFAPSGTVATIPAGTGTVILASRRIALTDNAYENNGTTDVAIINGLAIEGSEDSWSIAYKDLQGDWEDLGLEDNGKAVMNYRTQEILISGNTHSESGWDADTESQEDRAIGFAVGVTYGANRVDDVLYDTIGESSFDANKAKLNSNDNHICVGGNDGGTFASIDLETMAARMEAFDFPTIDDLYRPDAPFVPFDCTELSGGEIAEVSVTAP